MNLNIVTIKKLLFVILSLLWGNSFSFSEEILIDWLDTSTNEDGFAIEKRLLQNETFEIVSILPPNVESYIDTDIASDETYCYRISAFNTAGLSSSDSSCIYVSEDPIDEEKDNTSISHNFISNSMVIEVSDKEVYLFSSDEDYTALYNGESISNLSISANQGNIYHNELDYFSFQQNSAKLTSNYLGMGFNTENNLSFKIQANEEKTAILYLKAGAWSNETTGIIVTVGDKVEQITLPNGYGWHYLSVLITVDETQNVSVTTDSDQGGYSAVMFAGIVLEKTVDDMPINYASIVSIDDGTAVNVDVSDVKFMTYNGVTGNDSLSEAQVEALSFYGENQVSDNNYIFFNANGTSYTGYQSMTWSEGNGVEIQLKSADSAVNIAALYFSAGAWTTETASIELIVNGESEFIELTSGYSWKNMKVDVEFEGDLNIEIHPVGYFYSYSFFNFVGLTLN